MKMIHALAVSALLIGSTIAFQASASSITISPTSLRANDSAKAQVVTLENKSTRPLKYQVQIYTWTQIDGKDALAPTRDLLASPSMVELAPGAKQVVRVVRMRPSTGKSSYYRVIARELPSDEKATKSGVAMLVNHNLPASFEPAAASAPALSLTRRGNELAITNAGATAARLTEIASPDGVSFRKGALGWVLPGSTLVVPHATGSSPQLVLTVNGKPQTLSVN